MARNTLTIVLISIGILIGIPLSGFLLLLFGVSAYFGQPWRAVKAAHRQFHPGMNVQQIAAAFPTGYASGSIAVPMRTFSCKTAAGKILPSEFTDFPEIPADDAEGNRLKDQAEHFSSGIDDMEQLDQHLRGRSEWKLLTESWTAYINYFEDPKRAGFLKPAAYLRRGTAYLELEDFPQGYRDLSQACTRRVREACMVLKKLPREQSARLEIERRSADASMVPCEPELDWYSIRGPVTDERFRLEVNRHGEPDPVKVLLLSRKELADLLATEFKGRQWIANFMFDSNDFRTFWFYFVVDREGRLKEVTPITVQD